MRGIRGVYEEDGYTKIRIWLGPKQNPDNSFNKPYRRSFGPWNNENIRRAKDHIDRIRDDYKKGVQPQPDPSPISFLAASHIYFGKHWAHKRGRSSDSIKNTEYLLIRLRRRWAAQAWQSFTPQMIEDYIRDRQKEKMATGTINRELAIISSMFEKISDWNDRRDIGPFLLPTTRQGEAMNPVEKIERDFDPAAKRKRTASDDEIVKVIAYCKANDPDMLIMITRAIITGLRQHDLEKVNGLAHVSGILSKTKETKLFEFKLDFSQKISYKNYVRRWNALREACGMQDYHWHDWRHTSGTMLSRLGFTDKQIQEFYDHSTVEQTRGYINRREEQVQPMVDSIQAHIGGLSAQVPAYVPPDPATKRCLGCGELKPLEGYYNHSAFKSGLDSRCKACRDTERDKRRQANPLLRADEYARRKARRTNGATAGHA